VGEEEVDGSGGGGEGEGAEGAVEGARGEGGVDFLGEAGGEDDGEVVFFGEFCEGVEDGSCTGEGGIGEESVGETKVVGDGIDDDECEVGDGLDGFFEELEGVEVEDLVAFGIGDEGVEVWEEVDVIEVGGGCFEPGAEGVGGVVVWGEEEGGLGGFKFRVSSFKREGGGVGESGDEVEEESGFSGAGVSREEGEFSARDAVLPEPVDGFGWDGRETDCACGHGFPPCLMCSIWPVYAPALLYYVR
jgi:hypothetical protein